MNTIITFALMLALLGLAIAAPAEEGKKEDAEGSIGFGGGAFGGGFGGGFSQGGSFRVDSQGNGYGQGGFGYNVGRLNQRDTGKSATYGDSESPGLSGSSSHNIQVGHGRSRQRRKKQIRRTGSSCVFISGPRKRECYNRPKGSDDSAKSKGR